MTDARNAILALLDGRGPGKTICPSEAARQMTPAAQDWRRYIGQVHSAVDQLCADGMVNLSWKGQLINARRGPYRIARR